MPPPASSLARARSTKPRLSYARPRHWGHDESREVWREEQATPEAPVGRRRRTDDRRAHFAPRGKRPPEAPAGRRAREAEEARRPSHNTPRAPSRRRASAWTASRAPRAPPPPARACSSPRAARARRRARARRPRRAPRRSRRAPRRPSRPRGRRRAARLWSEMAFRVRIWRLHLEGVTVLMGRHDAPRAAEPRGGELLDERVDRLVRRAAAEHARAARHAREHGRADERALACRGVTSPCVSPRRQSGAFARRR